MAGKGTCCSLTQKPTKLASSSLLTPLHLNKHTPQLKLTITAFKALCDLTSKCLYSPTSYSSSIHSLLPSLTGPRDWGLIWSEDLWTQLIFLWSEDLWTQPNLQDTQKAEGHTELYHEVAISKIQIVGNSPSQKPWGLQQKNYKEKDARESVD